VEYVTIEALARDAERDVEVDGRRYRIRRLIASDVLKIFGELLVSPEAESVEPKAGASTAARVEKRLRSLGADERLELLGSSEDVLATALIVPRITREQLYLIPAKDRSVLVDAILALSGLSDPLASGAESAPASGS
jgi:hypothetical protein